MKCPEQRRGKLAKNGVWFPSRLPTIQSLRIPRGKLLQHKPVILQQRLARVATRNRSSTDKQWHLKRILFKR